MSRLTRDGTAKPVSRDQILRHARGQGNTIFPVQLTTSRNWQPYPVDPYAAICDDHTYVYTYILHNNESNLDRPGLLSPTHDQRSQQQTGQITLQRPVLINKSKFLKATQCTDIIFNAQPEPRGAVCPAVTLLSPSYVPTFVKK